MDEGYIKLFRQSIDSWVFKHQTAWKIWTWCLMKASYKERSVPIKIGKGVTIVTIKDGEFIFGRNKAEDALNIDGATIWRWINKFADEKNNMVSLKVSSHYTIVTICNWAKYQDEENTSEQPLSNQRAANEQPLSTNKKVKKVKKVKNKEYPQNSETEFQDTSISFPEEIVKFVKKHHKFNTELNPKIMQHVKLNLSGSCDAIDKLTRIDKYDIEEIRKALKYAANDDFWKFQIQSLASLRIKGKNRLMKFQNLYADYQRSLITPKNGHEEKPQVYTLPVKKEYI